jgi:hypothetical protein
VIIALAHHKRRPVTGSKPISVRAAAVITFDRAGKVATARLYVAVPTIVGRSIPAGCPRAPEGARTRAPGTSPPAGAAVITAAGTATEAANLAATDASWARPRHHEWQYANSAGSLGALFGRHTKILPIRGTVVRTRYEALLGPARADHDGLWRELASACVGGAHPGPWCGDAGAHHGIAARRATRARAGTSRGAPAIAAGCAAPARRQGAVLYSGAREVRHRARRRGDRAHPGP